MDFTKEELTSFKNWTVEKKGITLTDEMAVDQLSRIVELMEMNMNFAKTQFDLKE